MGRAAYSHRNRIVLRDHPSRTHHAFSVAVSGRFGARLYIAPLVTLIDFGRSRRFDGVGCLALAQSSLVAKSGTCYCSDPDIHGSMVRPAEPFPVDVQSAAQRGIRKDNRCWIHE